MDMFEEESDLRRTKKESQFERDERTQSEEGGPTSSETTSGGGISEASPCLTAAIVGVALRNREERRSVSSMKARRRRENEKRRTLRCPRDVPFDETSSKVRFESVNCSSDDGNLTKERPSDSVCCEERTSGFRSVPASFYEEEEREIRTCPAP